MSAVDPCNYCINQGTNKKSLFFFKKMVLVHFLDVVLFIIETHVQPIVPEHEHMKIHEHMNLYLDFLTKS